MDEGGAIAELSRVEIDALSGPAMIEFGNAWCGYCRAAQPMIVAALKKHPGVRHIRIADGSGFALGRSFQVKLWPTLVFLESGKEKSRLVRPATSQAVADALAEIDTPSR